MNTPQKTCVSSVSIEVSVKWMAFLQMTHMLWAYWVLLSHTKLRSHRNLNRSKPGDLGETYPIEGYGAMAQNDALFMLDESDSV